jgi:hypothetical protein
MQLRQSANRVLCFHEQIWDFASPDSRQPSFNFGMGANFDLDTNQLTAKCRFKSDQVGLLLLPEPALELRGKWRVFDSPLAVDVKYQCPVTNFTKFWESPAKVRVRFFNANHAGLHITPGGRGIATALFVVPCTRLSLVQQDNMPFCNSMFSWTNFSAHSGCPFLMYQGASSGNSSPGIHVMMAC